MESQDPTTAEAVTTEPVEQDAPVQPEPEAGENSTAQPDVSEQEPTHDAPVEADLKKPASKPKPKAKPKPKPRKTKAEKLAEADARERKAAKDASAAARSKKATPTGSRASRDPQLLLAHKATALATGGTVNKEGVLMKGTITFGAPVNSTQIKEMQIRVKGKSILQQVAGGVTEKALKDYARGDTAKKDLGEKASKAMTELNKTFDPKLKMWPRKNAAILFVLHMERKKGASKPKASTTKPKEEVKSGSADEAKA